MQASSGVLWTRGDACEAVSWGEDDEIDSNEEDEIRYMRSGAFLIYKETESGRAVP